jgi:hypothetical protein
MSTKTKIAALAVAAIVATGGIAATTQEAHAGGGGGPNPVGVGIGLGLMTAAVVGTAVAASQPHYYPVRRCGWTPQYNVFGQYVGSIQTCTIY